MSAPTIVDTRSRLEKRVAQVLADLKRVERLPDTGTHRKDCWTRHRDCLAARVEAQLRGTGDR